jgi:2-methylcitrate dehydratase PrpD
VTVWLKSGQSLSHEVSDYPGFATQPFTWKDMDAKLDKLAAGHAGEQLIQEIKDAVRSLEDAEIKDLTKLLGEVKVEWTDEKVTNVASRSPRVGAKPNEIRPSL